MWPPVKKRVDWEGFRTHVRDLPASRWRPSLVVLHNTAAPTLAQWKETEAKDVADGLVPGTRRINSLESYFHERGWSGAPHLFIPDDGIWLFNPLTAPGVHSPSWNSISVGIEMVADFDREDDDSGPGLVVRRSAIYATAVICQAFGLDPEHAVKLHRDDPKTTHACPGDDFTRDRDEVLAEIVEEVRALADGGEHDPHAVAVAIGARPPAAPKPARRGVVTEPDLNMRRGAGVSAEIMGRLPKGLEVAVLAEARNASTGWLQVRTPAGYVGWVAGRYVDVT